MNTNFKDYPHKDCESVINGGRTKGLRVHCCRCLIYWRGILISPWWSHEVDVSLCVSVPGVTMATEPVVSQRSPRPPPPNILHDQVDTNYSRPSTKENWSSERSTASARSPLNRLKNTEFPSGYRTDTPSRKWAKSWQMQSREAIHSSIIKFIDLFVYMREFYMRLGVVQVAIIPINKQIWIL